MERASGVPFRSAAIIVIGLEVCQWIVRGDTAGVVLINYLQLGSVAVVFGIPWMYHFLVSTGGEDGGNPSSGPTE
jgi:hypothetical protein